jgi:uncharacterized protein
MQRGLNNLRLWTALLALLAIVLHARFGFALQVPPLQGPVSDHAELLSPATEQSLTERLANYETKTGHQLAVLTIPSLEGDPVEDFSIRVVENWKLGKKGKDDGILLLVAAKEHKMRIEVGYGLEGDLPDIVAGRIVRDVMAPHFKRGDYDGGVSTAVDSIIEKTGGGVAQTAAGQPQAVAPKKPLGPVARLLSWVFKFAFFGIFALVLLFVLFINLFTPRRRYYGGGYFGGGGFGGGGFSGGGGGGFSGGGGGFGGGGASGDW